MSINGIGNREPMYPGSGGSISSSDHQSVRSQNAWSSNGTKLQGRASSANSSAPRSVSPGGWGAKLLIFP